MPKVGLRILKSALAVFLCFAVYLIRQDGMPFYSAIAAILCMQPYVRHSFTTALNRTIGSLVGGAYGLLILLLLRIDSIAIRPLLVYGIISAAIIPLMYLTVLMKKTPATYITCVVFLSVVVSHGTDTAPYWFALDRVIDTLIGIFISLLVNILVFPQKPPADHPQTGGSPEHEETASPACNPDHVEGGSSLLSSLSSGTDVSDAGGFSEGVPCFPLLNTRINTIATTKASPTPANIKGRGERGGSPVDGDAKRGSSPANPAVHPVIQ